MDQVDRLTVFGEEDEELLSPLPTIQTRCRGCDHVSRPGNASLPGHWVGIRVLNERCPQCDGRLEELFIDRSTDGYRRWPCRS